MYVFSLSIMYEYTIDVFRVAFGRSLPVEQQVPDPLRGFGRDDARGETERRIGREAARQRSSRSILALSASQNRRRCRPESLSSRRHETRRSGCSTPSRGHAPEERKTPNASGVQAEKTSGRTTNAHGGTRSTRTGASRSLPASFQFRRRPSWRASPRTPARPLRVIKPSTNPRNEVVRARRRPAGAGRRRRPALRVDRRWPRWRRPTRDRVQSILRPRLRHRPQKRGVPQHEHRERNRGARAEGELRLRRLPAALPLDDK